MRRLAPRHTTRRPAGPGQRTLTVCVVDPNADDYKGWRATAEARGLRLQFVASAEEALRFARTATVGLWVVNTELPGLSGYELCSMLKGQSPDTTVWMVANEYSADVERRVLASRATMFCCKATLQQATEPGLRNHSATCRAPNHDCAHVANEWCYCATDNSRY